MTQAPELPAAGVRVSLRYLRAPGSDPSMADVVGHLVETGPRVQIRSADGTIHECRLADVLYVRRLTDRPVKNSAIRAVEHAAAMAWPGSEHEWLDGWWLRAGHGATMTANSAVPLDMFARESTIPAIIDWYVQRGLPPWLAVPERLLRVPDNVPTEHETRTLVRDLDSDGTDFGASGVVLSPEPDAGWRDCYGRNVPVQVPVEVLSAVVAGEVAFASIPGVAVGRAAVTESPDGTRWVGLSALRVTGNQSDHARGVVCAALQSWGGERGATHGYTHVPAHDHAAFEFFESIGFTGQHRTRYLDARILHR